MTKQEIAKVYQAAQQITTTNEDLCAWDDVCDWTEKHYVTIKQGAALLRYQALQLNGEWNSEALRECFWILSKKTILVDTTTLPRLKTPKLSTKLGQRKVDVSGRS